VAKDSVTLLRVNPLPRFGILNNGRTDTTVCQNIPVRLYGPGGYQSYVWTSDSAGGKIGREYQIPSSDTTKFSLKLKVTDKFGCTNSDTVNIRVVECNPEVYIPTAFSPQGDRTNDLWRVQTYSVDKLKVYVFNRWGQMVFYTQDANVAWDGNFKGAACPSGNYKYIIEYEGDLNGQLLSNKKSGTITIIR